jgi:hypothetical protein
LNPNGNYYKYRKARNLDSLVEFALKDGWKIVEEEDVDKELYGPFPKRLEGFAKVQK